MTLRDFSILSGGHFGILATGVDNLTIDNLRIDTNRDGIDVDSCRNVRISNTSANTPNDDAIVLKTSFALGAFRPTENVTITNCFVSGYDIGSSLDGTYKRAVTRAPDRDGPTGRVKLGTESNGDFRNIVISNVVFDRARGLALESVDGSHIEDVAISNITMRDVSNAPIFIRLVYRGGLNLDQVAKEPPDLVNTFFFRASGCVPPRQPFDTPEREKEYPEPSMFGLIPASGFFIRHAKGIDLRDVRIEQMKEDRRPALVLDQARDIRLEHVDSDGPAGVPALMLLKTENVVIRNCARLPDGRVDRADRKEM